MNFSAHVTLKFDGCPKKTIGNLFYTTPTFVHHFVNENNSWKFYYDVMTGTLWKGVKDGRTGVRQDGQKCSKSCLVAATKIPHWIFFKFWHKFHCRVFPRASWSQHWFSDSLDAEEATGHYLNQWWQRYTTQNGATRLQRVNSLAPGRFQFNFR